LSESFLLLLSTYDLVNVKSRPANNTGHIADRLCVLLSRTAIRLGGFWADWEVHLV